MDKKTYEFISKQMNDPIVERKKCKRTGKDFPVFQGDIDLLKKVSPKIGGKQYDLPLPTLSREARERRRLMRRNDRKLYRSRCKITDKPLITFYHPEIEKEVVDSKERFNSVNNTDLGQDFDPNKTFGEQFSELMKKTVKKNVLNVSTMENSKYTHNVGNMKDCYMVFDSGICEDVLYTVRTADTKNVVDSFEVLTSENIYECVSVHNSNMMFYSQDCDNCSYNAFTYNCIGSNNCISCTNLVNKNYYVLNKKVSKEEFDSLRKKLFDGTGEMIDKVRKSYENLLSSTVRKAINMTKCEGSLGHNIRNCKNVFLSYEDHDIENCRYVYRIGGYSDTSNNMDINSWGGNMTHCYELNCSGSDDKTATQNCQFSSYLFWGVNNSQYSVNIPTNSEFLFGCCDLHTKKHCILNKQYTKEEYETLVPQVIGHMKKSGERGEFLDPKYSLFPYNDTIANDYYPVKQLKYPDGRVVEINLNGEGVIHIHEPEKIVSRATLDLGGEEKIETKRRTKDYDVTIPDNLESIDASNLQSDINHIDESIYDKAIICEKTKRPFRIIPAEIKFYKKYGLPLPKLHPDRRHLGRMQKITPLDMYIKSCGSCNKEFLSVYPQDSKFQVLCEECYNKEIY